MTEQIEKAIEQFERVFENGDPTYLYPEDCQAALSALREQLERQRGCEYCNEKMTKRLITAGARFCHKCGKKLEG